jgi:hypothetical protein
VTLTAADVAAPVASYAQRLHAAAGDHHHVASPLGAWLLLALCGPATAGEARRRLDGILGCDSGEAAELAAQLLASPHPAVPAAAAAWSRGQMTTGVAAGWLAALPACVPAGPMPGQADLDEWTKRHTLGLIEEFPGPPDPDLQLLVATVLATRVGWEMPFDLAPAAALGPLSPWAGGLSQVLRTPGSYGHSQFIAATETAGDVAVHIARASGGGPPATGEYTSEPVIPMTAAEDDSWVFVTSVAAAPDIPASQVLAAAYEVASGTAGREVQRRSLFDLPLGDGPLWSITERRDIVTSASGREERCTAVLPAWSAGNWLDLTPSGLGFDIAMPALVPGQPWGVGQAAVARYTRTGFEAAAVTAMRGGSAPPEPREGVVRTAGLRFGHPYAVVAVARDLYGRGPWNGLPVFSAWVAEPMDAEPQDAEPQDAEP